jgi:hypothetical protein
MDKQQPQRDYFLISKEELVAVDLFMSSRSPEYPERVADELIAAIRSRPHPPAPEQAKMEGTIPCPRCGAATWYQLADGFPTLFCYSATCHWKQQLGSEHDAVIVRIATLAARKEVVEEIWNYSHRMWEGSLVTDIGAMERKLESLRQSTTAEWLVEGANGKLILKSEDHYLNPESKNFDPDATAHDPDMAGDEQ